MVFRSKRQGQRHQRRRRQTHKNRQQSHKLRHRRQRIRFTKRRQGRGGSGVECAGEFHTADCGVVNLSNRPPSTNLTSIINPELIERAVREIMADKAPTIELRCTIQGRPNASCFAKDKIRIIGNLRTEDGVLLADELNTTTTIANVDATGRIVDTGELFPESSMPISSPPSSIIGDALGVAYAQAALASADGVVVNRELANPTTIIHESMHCITPQGAITIREIDEPFTDFMACAVCVEKFGIDYIFPHYYAFLFVSIYELSKILTFGEMVRGCWNDDMVAVLEAKLATVVIGGAGGPPPPPPPGAMKPRPMGKTNRQKASEIVIKFKAISNENIQITMVDFLKILRQYNFIPSNDPLNTRIRTMFETNMERHRDVLTTVPPDALSNLTNEIHKIAYVYTLTEAKNLSQTMLDTVNTLQEDDMNRLSLKRNKESKQEAVRRNSIPPVSADASCLCSV